MNETTGTIVPASRTGSYLVALTPESAAAILAREINIPHLPFRVGRESRRVRWTQDGPVGERRRSLNRSPDRSPDRSDAWSADGSATANNDLYLVEDSEPMNVSREHFLIGRDADGFFLQDRGSTCGTLVEGELVGGDGQPGRVALADHHVIVVGTSLSRYIFKFRLET